MNVRLLLVGRGVVYQVERRGRVANSPTGEGTRKEDGDEDGEEKFQVLVEHDRTGHAWHGFWSLGSGRARQNLKSSEVRRSEVKLSRSLACLLACAALYDVVSVDPVS